MKSTERFSDRVAHYIKYRPGYPDAVLDLLVGLVSHPKTAACADFGSGTGMLSRGLLQRFGIVYGVEPNREMRSAGETSLAHARFVSVDGTAEASQLADASVDLVTVALIWNNRLADTPFLETYDQLLRTYATDYNEVNHQNITTQQWNRFFDRGYRRESFSNVQSFDLEGVFGRLDSSSYAPRPGTDAYDALRKELTAAFEQSQTAGIVDFRYETEVYVGLLNV